MKLIRLERSKKAFNCKTMTENETNAKIVLCEPVEITPDGREIPIGKEPVKFRIEGKIPVLISDGGVDRETLKELDEYIERFIR